MITEVDYNLTAAYPVNCFLWQNNGSDTSTSEQAKELFTSSSGLREATGVSISAEPLDGNSGNSGNSDNLGNSDNSDASLLLIENAVEFKEKICLSNKLQTWCCTVDVVHRRQ